MKKSKYVLISVLIIANILILYCCNFYRKQRSGKTLEIAIHSEIVASDTYHITIKTDGSVSMEWGKRQSEVLGNFFMKEVKETWETKLSPEDTHILFDIAKKTKGTDMYNPGYSPGQNLIVIQVRYNGDTIRNYYESAATCELLQQPFPASSQLLDTFIEMTELLPRDCLKWRLATE